MINTIYPCPVSFCPLDSFCPIPFCPLEMVEWFTLFTHVPYHFAPCIRLRFHTNKKPFTTKAYDRRASGDRGTSGEIIPYYSGFHVFAEKVLSASMSCCWPWSESRRFLTKHDYKKLYRSWTRTEMATSTSHMSWRYVLMFSLPGVGVGGLVFVCLWLWGQKLSILNPGRDRDFIFGIYTYLKKPF